MCLLVAGLWHGAISKSCPVCVPTLNLSLSLAASQTPKSIPPGKESPPLTSAQALRARVTTILPGQRAAGCEWRGPHQPKGLAETQGCGEWDGEHGCPSKAMSDLGWGWCPGAGQGTLPLGDQTWAPTAYATPAWPDEQTHRRPGDMRPTGRSRQPGCHLGSHRVSLGSKQSR